MAKFIYSLQKVLTMKEKLEEQEKNKYSQAVMRLREQEEKLAGLQNRRKMAETELRDVVSHVLDIMLIRKKEDAVEILKMYEKQQRFVVKQHEEEVRIARERLNEAMQERKIHEKLREKAFEEFVIEENKREQKEIDELVSYRFGSAKNDLN